jgi:hypothetical protein
MGGISETADAAEERAVAMLERNDFADRSK